MAGKKFKALDNGTISNPYRFIQKGMEVELTDEEAEFYKDCKWLVPLKKAKEIVEPPLMSHMNLTNNKVNTAMDAIAQLPVDPAYAENMKLIIGGERARDGKAAETTETKPDAAGTGNQTVI